MRHAESPFRHDLERFVTSGLMAGTLATLLVVARNDLAPYQEPSTFGLVFWHWLLLYWTLLAFSSLLVASWAQRRLERPWLARAALAALSLAFLAVASVNRNAWAALLHLEGPAGFDVLCLASAGSALVALVLAPLAWGRGRWATRVAALTALACFQVALQPAPRPVAASPLASVPARLTGQRLLLVAVDGASWTHAEPLLARGELPNLAALRARGAWGPLGTLEPTLSPVVWTTVATGQLPRRHGITDFTVPRLSGVDSLIPTLQPLRGLGFGPLLSWLERGGVIRPATVTSDLRRVPALWTVASLQGSPMNVVGWFVSWPAEPILGVMVSERIPHFPPGHGHDDSLVHPPELQDQIRSHVTPMADVTLEQARRFMDVTPVEFEQMQSAPVHQGWNLRTEFKYFYSVFDTNRRIALSLMADARAHGQQPVDLLVYFRLVDKVKHTSLGYSELIADPIGTPEDRRRYGRAVSEAYRTVDQALGELLQAFGDGNVIVLSDHGFEMEPHRDTRIPGHGRALPGMFAAAGPAITATGRVEGVSVLDVLPLIVRLKGLPLSEELPGRVPDELIVDAFEAAHPISRVRTYGRMESLGPGHPMPEIDEEMMARLRALGYIK